MSELSSERYALLYGPTAGDRIRLADTSLLIEVERDLCAGGDEAVFGGGKVIRESMGQAVATRAEGAPDLVITGAVILDHWGIVKADVGVRDGRIVAIGKAGNPDIMDGVHPALVIGPSTEIMAGNGLILTAGGIDCHVHLISPTQLPAALGSGITTLIGGGTGPAEGTKATTVTPGAWNLARMLEATDPWPMNIVLLGKGNTVSEDALWEQLRAGAAGFKLHEDWGTTPAAIDACLRVSMAAGVQTSIHTDTLNEAGFVEDTLAAIAEDLAFAESRIRPSTIAAEDILHDMGAISMIGSDSQAMGRIGEVVIRTWQTAHAMKERRGALAGYGAVASDSGGARGADNARARRYVAKYTICPAVAHGLDSQIGSVEPGKLADLVLWHPAFFGVRPHAVLKGGFVAWAAMGDANASIPTPQPILPRPMWGAYGKVPGKTSLSFVSPAALEAGLADRLGLVRDLVPVTDISSRGKADMVNNDALPDISVDPDTFTVRIDGEVVEAAPATVLPMAQRYFLF